RTEVTAPARPARTPPAARYVPDRDSEDDPRPETRAAVWPWALGGGIFLGLILVLVLILVLLNREGPANDPSEDSGQQAQGPQGGEPGPNGGPNPINPPPGGENNPPAEGGNNGQRPAAPPPAAWPGHEATVYSVAFSRDGRYALSGSGGFNKDG